MKRFLIILLVAMVALVLACGSEEEKAPVKAAAPEKVEEGSPQPPLVAPKPAAPEAPKAGQPEAEHPKGVLNQPKKTNLKKKPKRKPKKAKPRKVQQSP